MFSRLSCLAKKKSNIGHSTQTVLRNFFLPAMLIGTIHFYHFIPLSLTLTVPGGHKVSAKQYLLASFSPTPFIWSGWNLMWWSSNSGWTSWDYFQVRLIRTREITAILLTVSKKLSLACFGMFMNRFDSNLVWWWILWYFTFWYFTFWY